MRDLAIFTLARNETVFLPLWLRYYSRTGANLFVLDHESTDTVVTDVPFECVPVANPTTDDAGWMLRTVETFQRQLLRDYGTVIYAEADELLAPVDGAPLRRYLDARPLPDAITATGFDICDRGGPPDYTTLRRCGWRRNDRYDKTLIARRPLSWEVGFHRLSDSSAPPPDPALRLLHLHYAWRETAWNRLAARMRDKPPAPGDLGWQNKFADRDLFEIHFDATVAGAVPVPAEVGDLL